MLLKLEEFQDVYCVEAGQRLLLRRGALIVPTCDHCAVSVRLSVHSKDAECEKRKNM